MVPEDFLNRKAWAVNKEEECKRFQEQSAHGDLEEFQQIPGD
jgi:hypothetical protein